MIKQIKNFKKGMTPDLYGDGLVRVEHFDNTTPQLRPFRTLGVSTHNGDVDLKDLIKFCRGYKDTTAVIWALGKEDATGYPAIAYWDSTNFKWYGMQSFNAAGTCADVLFQYSTKLYGLWKGTHMWEMTTSSSTYTLNGTFKARSYTYYAEPIIHSKDGLAYIPTDNIISSFDGTNLSTVYTLPTNFRITSISEQGDYINVVGYDTKTNQANSFLWDRDSSLATSTAKYDLGIEVPYHNATLGGTHFIVSLETDSANTTYSENKQLVIRYINGEKPEILNKFSFAALSIGGKYQDNNKLYFNAYVKFLGESAGEWVVFQLDEQGKLAIALNVGINDAAGAAAEHPGIFRDGDGFWIGGRTDGAWDTASANTYTTTSFVQTTKYRADKLDKNLDLLGCIVTFEALPAAGQVILKTRADSTAAWTTLATWTTDNAVKGSITGAGIPTAKERQFRIESTGGAVITGFQADFEEVNNEVYG